MNTPPHPDDTRPPTVADLVEHWNGVREHGPLAPATAAAYLGSIARILARQGITADTQLDDLDLDALREKFAAANPDLKPITLANNTNNLRSAITGYHARHRPAPASTTPFTPPPPNRAGEPEPAHPGTAANTPATPPHAAVLDGTLATLPAFLALAGRRGLLEQRTAQVYAATAQTILATQPDLAARQVTDLDPAAITATFAAHHPAVADSDLESYHARLSDAVTAYLAYLHAPAAPIPPPASGGESRPGPGFPTRVALPRGRAVSLRTPPDLTDAEARAAGGVLRLYHPHIFASEQPGTAPAPPAGDESGRWTLVFWPEHAPEEPESAHITGETFTAALADYARTRHPGRALLGDGEAIDAWFSSEVFFVSVIDGHHEARDAGTLL